jgi:hypothetical protein
VWFAVYVAARPSEDHAFSAMMRLIQRFVQRYATFLRIYWASYTGYHLSCVRSHGFSCRVPCFTKKPSEELLMERLKFTIYFRPKYSLYDTSCIINVDETAIYSDSPPGRTWAVKGGSSRARDTQRHSLRMTAALTISADGRKSLFSLL